MIVISVRMFLFDSPFCLDVVTITHTFGGVREMQDNEYLYSSTMAYEDNFSFKFEIKRNPAGYLSIYLTCDNPAQTWSLNTGRLIRLISGKNGVHSAQRFSNDRTYTPSSNSWGFSKFILWADLVNDDNGYINDDGEITIEVLIYPHSFSINQGKKVYCKCLNDVNSHAETFMKMTNNMV